MWMDNLGARNLGDEPGPGPDGDLVGPGLGDRERALLSCTCL